MDVRVQGYNGIHCFQRPTQDEEWKWVYEDQPVDIAVMSNSSLAVITVPLNCVERVNNY